jgi:hypothetical protein
LTAFTVPRHLLLFQPPALITSGFLTFSFFSGVGLLAPRQTPNLEDQVSEFISPGDRVAQLYPWTLGSSGTSGSPLPVLTYVGPWGGKGYQTTEELKAAVRNAFTPISQRTQWPYFAINVNE